MILIGKLSSSNIVTNIKVKTCQTDIGIILVTSRPGKGWMVCVRHIRENMDSKATHAWSSSSSSKQK